MTLNLIELFKVLTSILPKCFYGKIELSFENGMVVNIKKTESIKVIN